MDYERMTCGGVKIYKSDEQIKADVLKARWRGINLELDGDKYMVTGNRNNIYNRKSELYKMGFRFNRYWLTESKDVAVIVTKFINDDNITPLARDALKNEIRLRDSEKTMFRWTETYVDDLVKDNVRSKISSEVLEALREAVASLCNADEDRATVSNGNGWSKAHSEVGHTLHLLGIKKFSHAAVAWKLCWSYRKQLSVAHMGVLFSEELCGQEHV